MKDILRLQQTIEGHTDGVLSVAISPDNTMCLSGSSDTTMRLWNLEKGVIMRIFEGHG